MLPEYFCLFQKNPETFIPLFYSPNKDKRIDSNKFQKQFLIWLTSSSKINRPSRERPFVFICWEADPLSNYAQAFHPS